jgi:hypothetical protein
MLVNDAESADAKKTDEITLQVSSPVRRNDKVYLIEQIHT